MSDEGLLPRAAAQLGHMDEGMGAMRAALHALSQDLDASLAIVAALWADNMGGPNAEKYFNLITGAKEAIDEADGFILGAQAKVISAVVNIGKVEGKNE